MTILSRAINLARWARRRHAYKLVVGNALFLLFASWLPSRVMVRTETLSGLEEHALAYFLTGIAVTVLLAGYRAVWHIALGLVVYAGVLELGQYFAPGRSVALSDFFMSSAGGLAGVAVGALLLQVYARGMRGRRVPLASNP